MIAASSLALAQPMAPQPAAGRGGLPAALTGRWRVVAVGVSDSGIQALSENDPSYMGRVIEIDPNRLIWLPGAKPGATEDRCRSPTVDPLPAAGRADDEPLLGKIGFHATQGYRVRCGSGRWGPVARLYTSGNGTLALPWYDGAMLELARS